MGPVDAQWGCRDQYVACLLGPIWGSVGTNIGPVGANIGPVGTDMEPLGTNMEPMVTNAGTVYGQYGTWALTRYYSEVTIIR